MSREIHISQRKKENIERACKSIRPIVVNSSGRFCYLRPLNEKEFDSFNLATVLRPSDFAEFVDFTQLSVLEDMKVLHKIDNPSYFSANKREIVSQISQSYLETNRVVALQIVYNAIKLYAQTYETFKGDFDSGYNVSIVRLYSQKMPDRPEAHPLAKYPDEDFQKPRWMSVDEFLKFRRLFF